MVCALTQVLLDPLASPVPCRHVALFQRRYLGCVQSLQIVLARPEIELAFFGPTHIEHTISWWASMLVRLERAEAGCSSIDDWITLSRMWSDLIPLMSLMVDSLIRLASQQMILVAVGTFSKFLTERDHWDSSHIADASQYKPPRLLLATSRALTAIIHAAVLKLGMSVSQFDLSEEVAAVLVHQFMEVELHVVHHPTHVGSWLTSLSANFAQCHGGLVWLDLAAFQLGASILGSEDVAGMLATIMERHKQAGTVEATDMAQVLLLIVSAIKESSWGQVSISDRVRRDIVHTLAAGPCCYAQFVALHTGCGLLSSTAANRPEIDKALGTVAYFKPSASIEKDAHYQLNKAAYEEYDASFFNMSRTSHEAAAEQWARCRPAGTPPVALGRLPFAAPHKVSTRCLH